MDPRPDAAPEPRRSAAALFAGVAASALGYTMMVAVLPLAAEDLLHSPLWSGLPSAFGTLGVAFGTTWLARLMARRRSRSVLAQGYAASMFAACLAALGAAFGLFLVMAAAIFGVGAGYASSRLSRYAAADLFPPARRSSAIGWNVWAATVGSVAGPLLLGTTLAAGLALGIPETASPFLVAAIAFGLSALVLHLRFTPAPAVPSGVAAPGAPVDHHSPAGARFAVVSLTIGQVVMVLIMTMTPIHIRHSGQGLQTVGVVFASHTFGMYAFAPLAGMISDRIGRVPVMVAACLMLSTAGVVAAQATAGAASLAIALFLLGLGWSFSFVAASALLTESVHPSRRIRIQGAADSLVWGSAAFAGLASGFLLTAIGYAALSHLGAVTAIAPLAFLRRDRSTGDRGHAVAA